MIIDATREKVLYSQECSALYCALTSESLAFELIEHLAPEDFYDSRTRKICSAIIDIIQGSESPNFSSVKRRLKMGADLNCLEEDIAKSNASLSDFNDFVEFVKEESRLRQLDEACLQLRSQIGETLTSDDLVGDMMQKLISISMGTKEHSFTPIDKLFDETFEEIKRRQGDELIGFPTSVKALDKMIGGWQPKKLYCVAGRPGMAKTALAMQSACHLAYHHDVPVAFFSIEMPERELMERIISNITGVEYWRITKRWWAQEHLDKIADASKRLKEMPLYICDSGGITLNQIIAKCKALKIKTGKELGPIFIDYLQLMKIHIQRGGNRDIAIGEVTRSLKQLSKDLPAPVVIISQVKRAVEEREDKRPTLADLRESGNIEQDTDVCIFPYRDSYYTKDVITEKDCEFIIPKQRAGKTGIIEVHVDLDYQRFYDPQGD